MITFKELGNLGRLGNQLFQIAATIGYAKKYGQDYCFNNWNYSEHFKVPLDNNNNVLVNTRIEDENTLGYFTIRDYDANMGNVDLYGYFQSEKYFIHCKDVILNMFKTNYNKLSAGFIHIRRGDYLKYPDYHTNLSLDYYINGMDKLSFKKYYCFSDDIEWCKNNIIDSRLVFVENTSEIEDLKLMQQCSGAIIANSSFSWWGAYLSESKEVIIPNKWFGPLAGNYNIEDKLCDGWIAL